MKKTLYLIVILLSISFIYSCDDIANPLKEKQEGTCGDENSPTPIRKILIADYTGHTCGNCPRAAEKIAELKNTYCDHIIPIAIHVGVFAEPDEHYPEDFRTKTGNELDDYFAVSNKGLPNGIVNRTEFAGNTVIAYSDWTSAVAELLKTNPEINIEIENSYNKTTRNLTVEINSEFLKDTDKKLNLSVYLIEDSIVAPQKDYSLDPSTIEDYIHRHVFRASLNGTWGDEISASGAKFGDIISKNYSFEISKDFNENRCEIIAFIYETESKKIIQAESEHIK